MPIFPNLSDFAIKDFSTSDFLAALNPRIDAKGAARYLASKTATPLDDLFADKIAESLQSLFDDLVRPAPMQTFAIIDGSDVIVSASVTEEDMKRDRILRRAEELGVVGNPLVIYLMPFLLQFTWAAIERFLSRLAK